MKAERSATVADLRNNFATVSRWLRDGRTVLITKRGRPFANLTPVRAGKAGEPVDRMKRLQRRYPEGPVRGDLQAIVSEERGQT